jgi:hypothetical protein
MSEVPLYMHAYHLWSASWRITLLPLTAIHLHCIAGSSRSFTAIRKDAGLYCGPRLRKGQVFAYVGLPQNLKDLNVAARDAAVPNRVHRVRPLQGYLTYKKTHPLKTLP